jgi:hypothetical protein|nr:MAG TPA: hypothetical protein [Caudoviricetes sp.]
MKTFKANELPIDFHRLALGAILEHPNGERWAKIYFEGEPVWTNTFNVDEAYKTNDQMLDFIEYDVWKVLP